MYDVVIIGCGVIGAAAAYELSRYDLKIAVLESENDVATGSSKANSAILHAGYDPKPGTLMAKLNVEGNELAFRIAEKLHVPADRCGSLVVAFDEKDEEHLNELYRRGIENGVPGLSIISGDKARELEPNLSEEIRAALLAESAGIISPWDYTLAMAEVAVKNGTELFLNTRVTSIEKGECFTVRSSKGRIFKTRYVINAAGVNSDIVSEMVGDREFSVRPTAGEYYLLDKSEGERVSRVIFQCPNELGKGVLVSRTVHGNLIVGPNAVETDRGNTATTREGLAFVQETAKRSVPGIQFRENIRNFAGIRANTEFDEFCIGESRSAKGFLNLGGIKSPGLTAAAAIGRYAAGLLKDMGLELIEKDSFDDTREVIRFKELSDLEKNELIKRDPAFGRVICRCETITEGEIVAALHSVIPARSINGVKRRCNAGMGRCQGGFCSPRVCRIIARELGIDETEVVEEKEGSNVLYSRLKEV
ncbi:MAG: NAD(P)/FAD-dependent oxidoreductase [Oscillospiraceae bacterium]|nr:NAD(P)/FAD-dependent oxidoreductase [Oscillospiraceae bacterium]